MNRRQFVAGAAGLLGSVTALKAAEAVRPFSSVPARSRFRIKPFAWEEATISQLQGAMQSGQETAASLARKYLIRIDEIDRQGPSVNSVLEVNPDALKIAAGLDRERREKGPRGPLHGIPVLLKDNIDTADGMQTTAGSLALLDSKPALDSFLAQRLREAGAVILGKTNLSEWANFRSSHASSGWSGRGGQTANPYALDRNPSGSSSGSAAAVSANFCAVAVGTETDGSIISPSTVCGIVGIKPTLGLISRAGVIPIAHSQDTAGPMARTVTDAAILLGALAGVDPRDPTTLDARGKIAADYRQFLKADGLRGARVGIARKFFRPGSASDKIMEGALAALKDAGAILVDPADLPSMGKFGEAESEVLHYEFKAALNVYLAARTGGSMRTLGDLIEFNEKNRDREMPYFGQEIFLRAQAKGPLTDKTYLEALEKSRRLSRAEGIDSIMDTHQLDALVAPSGGPAGKTDLIYGDRGVGGSSSPAAMAGYPSITVPAGHVLGLPVGISFFGRAFSEPVLLRLAFAFEQSTKARQAPRFLASIG